MLESEHVLSGASFITWWKTANQSRDFWVETELELIRIHVVPRKHLFNPSSWKTTLSSLKQQLISRLDGHRITEHIPCLGEGVVSTNFEDDTYHNTDMPHGLVYPWIGRSRFRKIKPDQRDQSCLSNSGEPADAFQRTIAMVHEAQRVGGRAGSARDCRSSQLDGARVEVDPVGAKGAGEAAQGGEPSEGAHQDDLGGALSRSNSVGDQHAASSDQGPADEAHPRCEEHPRADFGDLRQVQGMDVSRSPTGVSPMEHAGGEGKPELLTRSGEARHMGAGRSGTASEDSEQLDRGGQRPGSQCGGASTQDEGSRSPWGVLRCFVEQGQRLLLTSGGGSSRTRDHQRQRSGGRGGGSEPHHQEVGGQDLSAQEAQSQLSSAAGGEISDTKGIREEEIESKDATVLKPMGGLDYEVKYVCSGDDAPDERKVSEYKDTVGLSTGDYKAKYDTNTNDSPDENEVFVNEVMLGLSSSESSGDGPRSGSPKARARAGMKRRKMARRSTTQFMKDQAKGLCTVLLACTVAMGGWAREVMADPLWEAWAVLQPRHYERDNGGTDCLELFAGHARISSAYAKRHRAVLQPRDLKYDHNLKLRSQQEEVLSEILEHRPKLLWMAPPCTYWCKFSRLNYEKQELRRLRKREGALVNFTARVFELQHSLGGIAVIENPKGSDLWRHPALQRFVGVSATFAEVDLCTFGLRSLQDGRPLRKPLALLTNNTTFGNNIAQKCEDGSHDRRPVQGRDTAWTAVYPTAFANAVVRAADQAWRCPNRVFVQFPTDLAQAEDANDEQLQALEEEDWEPDSFGAAAISFKGKVNPKIASVLKRIHQNLGHPPNRDLVRHLRIGGAPDNVIRAAEQMVCRTCERSTRPASSRVAHPCVALDFNEVIAADVIWLDTSNSRNRPALNVIDLASTYQVVIPVASTKSEELARAMLEGWINWAGAPKHLLVDLDSGFRDQFLQLMDSRSVIVRCAAGQAHWQNGVCERHGATWKNIWKKLVEDLTVTDEEFTEAVACTSDAKNQLRNKSGYSPRQWVFGTQMKMAGDLFDSHLGPEELDNITADEKVSRSHAIRLGARSAFFRCQTKDALQRAAQHKARVEKQDFAAGDLVFIHRELRQRKGKKSGSTWIGPGTIIGKEGHNFWVARGGRCLLAAPEHLRTAHHEEVSEMLRIKASIAELRKVVENADDDIIDQDYEEEDQKEEMEWEPGDEEIEQELAMEEDHPNDPVAQAQRREREIEAHVRRRQALDDLPISLKKPRKVFMMKHAISEKGKEKQLEKEIPWQLIPPDERQLYREAEQKQWDEHLQFGAVKPLSLAESEEVFQRIKPDRVLNSRFIYRDKNYAKRKVDPSVPPRAKARLCIAGQNDPDLGKVDMATDAPTTSKHSIILALQLALNRGWKVSVGDIRAAFLNGIPAPRELYFRQPKRGIPGLQPGQLIEVLKGVFGLSTSPKLWWMKLSGDVRKMKVDHEGDTYHVVQNVIDPCVFQFVKEADKSVCGLLLTHVDDLMLMAPNGLAKHIQSELKRLFPVDEWEEDTFEYVGCEYKCSAEEVVISQHGYAKSRVEKVTIERGVSEEQEASIEQIEENRTVIGCLSWLAKQTRPDIQFQVCQAQKKQRTPSIADLKQTNKAVTDTIQFQHCGVTLRKIPEERLCFLAYHDAAWANTQPDAGEEQDFDWIGDHQVASQLGSLVLLADITCLGNEGGRFSLVDWKSKAAHRVCRSTFAGETMACSEGLEGALFLRGLYISFATGARVPDHQGGQFFPLHLVTDCRSLYDHIHREGVPRAPAEKRLAIDLAGLRQALMIEAEHQWRQEHGEEFKPTPERPLRPPLHWLPTHEQLADILTKRLKPTEWWGRINSGWLSLPLKTMPRQDKNQQDFRPV